MIRILHIDIARGIGILLVVAGHNWIVLDNKGELYRIIYSVHIPMFFILAGVFFDAREPFKLMVREKYKRLLVPYFVTGVVAMCLFSLITKESKPISYELLGLLYGTGPHLNWVNLWFLPNLFLVSIFCWGCLNLFNFQNAKGYVQILVVTICIALGWLMIRAFWNMEFFWKSQIFKINGLPFSADILLITSAYYLVGFFAQNWIKNMELNFWKFCIPFVVFITLHILSDYTTDINLRRYDAPLIATILALSGSILVLNISKLVSFVSILEKIFVYLGKNSLSILLFHSFFQDTTFTILAEYSKRFFYIGVCTFIISIVSSIILIEGINRVNFLKSIFKTSQFNSY